MAILKGQLNYLELGKINEIIKKLLGLVWSLPFQGRTPSGWPREGRKSTSLISWLFQCGTAMNLASVIISEKC